MTSPDERDALRAEADGLEREIRRLREELESTRGEIAALDADAEERAELARVQQRLRVHRQTIERRPGLYGGWLYRFYRRHRGELWPALCLGLAGAAWILWRSVERR